MYFELEYIYNQAVAIMVVITDSIELLTLMLLRTFFGLLEKHNNITISEI